MKKSGEIKKICEIHNCEKNIVKIGDKITNRWICKQCKIEYDVKYRNKTSAKRQQQQHDYYKTNKEKILKNNKIYYHNNTAQILLKKQAYTKNNKTKKTETDKRYYEKNKIKRIQYAKNYATKNEENTKKYQSEYYLLNADKLKYNSRKMYKENRERARVYAKIYVKQRRIKDVVFKLHLNVSHSIRECLKAKNISKNKKSIIAFLPYTIKKLSEHLERQFEPWMNWSNWGQYKIDKWDDADPLTWKWQIDHIIPHSAFNYASMEDEKFKKCWDLSNLRPYSAKQNVKDGDRNRELPTTKVVGF